MCGIAGILETAAAASAEELGHRVSAMTDTLRHRGPDGVGTWVDESSGIALGHQRLAIVDLSPEGAQPKISHNQRYVVSFNGEIYNFLELRRELEGAGAVFSGRSDTEVLLEAIAHWGLERALGRFVGMFAFALWDREERTLTLARDRLGEKPLYYGWFGNTLLFGSELKALRAHPAFAAEVDRTALQHFLRHAYVPSERSIYAGVKKLRPAHLLKVGGPHPREAQPRAYWSAVETAVEGCRSPLDASEDEVLDELGRVLRRAVSGQMISDVPLGAFLSGGVDSSLVVALMQDVSAQPVRTFSIGFNEPEYNEAHHAAAVAKHLGTMHTELYVSPEQALALVPSLPTIFDEPFADPSQIPTILVAQLAHRSVTVSLSGDGGDELFGGYTRYTWGKSLAVPIRIVPQWMRLLGAKGVEAIHERTWARIMSGLGPVLPRALRQTQPGRRLHTAAKLLRGSPEDLYLRLVSHWKDPHEILARPPSHERSLSELDPRLPSFMTQMMCQDAVSYLPDDILTKVDRATMSASLESRAPFLDHRVYELAWGIPERMKVRGTDGKRVLKRLLARFVPSGLFQRPKMGFGVPIDSWLRGPLRHWGEDLLSPARILSQGFLNSDCIQRHWSEHLSGQKNHQYALWNVLMFQAWLDANNLGSVSNDG